MKNKLLALFCCLYQCCYSAPIDLVVDSQVILEDAERIGINLGTWTTWGAEQLNKNIVMNPGFEGYIDRIIVIVSQADKASFSDEPNWGYDDDYWKNAIFEVRTGTSKGTFGKISSSKRKGAHDLPQYTTEKPLPELSPRDIITITKLSNGDPVPLWWIDDNSKEHVHIDTTQRRPLSSGTQALALEPKADKPVEINYYFDAIADRAGKMLSVNGKWRFTIWMKAENPGDNLQVAFRRINGSAPFFDKTFPTTTEWQEYTFDFEPQDNGAPQTLQLKIDAIGKGKIWLDDVFLGPIQNGNNTNFRQEVVDVLLKLKPSFIRDTQGQLGDTLENRMADIYARKAMSSRAFAGTRNLSTGYSIPDLLQLCQIVQANPWIVIPPTFSDEEALHLGEYLAIHANKKVFSAVIVEYGNENWNYLFRATGIPYPHEHGLVADKIFDQIQQGAGSDVNLRRFVNGQHAVPNAAKDFAQFTPNADTVAIAPYFFSSLDTGHTQEENLQSLFKDDAGLMKQLVDLLKPMQKKLAIYEVNLDTNKGNAKGAERDPYTNGQAAGSALAKRLMEGMLLGIEPEMIFSLAQFDSDTVNHEKVRLWGIVRDLGGTNRLRPQGLAMLMLNAVIGGNLHPLIHPEAATPLTGMAFKENGQWKAALVNASATPQELSIKFPEGTLPNSLWILQANSPLDTNENEEKVTISLHVLEANGNKVKLTVPAWGFVTLANKEQAAS